MTQLLARAAMALPLTSADAMVARGLVRLAGRKKAQACVAECATVHECGLAACCDTGTCYWGSRYCDDCGGAFCYIQC
jgi:hypothetical protein